jgi:hypothetical protein
MRIKARKWERWVTIIEFVSEWTCYYWPPWTSKRSINNSYTNHEQKITVISLRQEKEEKEEERKKTILDSRLMQLGKSLSSSTTAASLSLFTIVACAIALFSLFLVCLIVVVCYYTKDVVCLSIKDINLLIRETE